MSRAAGGKKFGKLDVKRVYFGNWLRDYSQAVDVGTVKYVSAEAIRIILWVLGFMSFGYGTKEFEVTTERLGCYRLSYRFFDGKWLLITATDPKSISTILKM